MGVSAVILQMVLRKRAVEAQFAADILARDEIIAQARGEKGDPGTDGRGIEKLSIDKGDLIVTYTDKKKQNVGKVVSERVVVVAGGSTPEAAIIEDLAMYAKRVDFISDNLFYKGEALPGSSVADPVWRIVRTTIGSDGDVSDEWVDGSAGFSHRWIDRLTYTYS